jgi:hypothetical protein
MRGAAVRHVVAGVAVALAWVLWLEMQFSSKSRGVSDPPEWRVLDAYETADACRAQAVLRATSLEAGIRAEDKYVSVERSGPTSVAALTRDGYDVAGRLLCLPETVDPRTRP